MDEGVKISNLESLESLSVEDVFPVVQNGATKTFKANFQVLKEFIYNSQATGAALSFSYGVPENDFGKTTDVYFDLLAMAIYQKTAEGWELKLNLAIGLLDISFVSTEGQDFFQHDLLQGAKIKHLFIDGFFNGVACTQPDAAGKTLFSYPLNANCKVTIYYY